MTWKHVRGRAARMSLGPIIVLTSWPAGTAQPGNGLLDLGAEETAVFAGGCFWGIEAVYDHIKGVSEAVSGYAGGTLDHPTYEQVTSGETGHAESVRVTFDPAQISYAQLLEIFFRVAHDPTQLNRQGPDRGTQYRSAIFYANDEQARRARDFIDRLTREKVFARPIVTQLVPLTKFYQAEDYHQDFVAHHPIHPYVLINDLPKVHNLRRQFPKLYRE